MTTLPPYPTYEAPATSTVPFPTLAKQAVSVKGTFDFFAGLVRLIGVLAVIGFIIAAVSGEGQEGYFFLALIIAAYVSLAWAGLKLAGLVAGHIANKN